MSIKGQPGSFYKKFKFIVRIDGIDAFEFEKAGPLEMEVAKVEQWQGGRIIAQKEPGRTTFPDCVLVRGKTSDLQIWNWMKTVSDASKNGGTIAPDYKKTVDIIPQDRDNTTLKPHRLFNAWPCKLKAGEWDNTADENVVEEVTLCYDYFDIIDPS